jgi:hypothetical protein
MGGGGLGEDGAVYITYEFEIVAWTFESMIYRLVTAHSAFEISLFLDDLDCPV